MADETEANTGEAQAAADPATETGAPAATADTPAATAADANAATAADANAATAADTDTASAADTDPAAAGDTDAATAGETETPAETETAASADAPALSPADAEAAAAAAEWEAMAAAPAGGDADADAWGAALAAPAEDAAAEDWGVSDRALDQSDIDNMFGDPSKPAGDTRTREGFAALVGGDLAGIERMPTLNIVIDRLAQLMKASLRVFTADNADVKIEKLRAVRLKDFLDAIELPGMIAVIRVDQWDGYCLAALNPLLVNSMVDLLLGGRTNKPQPVDGRPATAIERTFLERLVREVIAPDLKSAFEMVGVVDFVLERFETTPSYAAITKLGAAAVSFRTKITIEDRGGHIDFLLPFATLDPVHDILVQDFVGKKKGGDSAWRTHLMSVAPGTTMRLRAIIEQRRISALEVMRWRPGSRLLLNQKHDEPINVTCEELPVLRAHIAEKDGHIALRIHERRLAEDWPDEPEPQPGEAA
jgi:flagellar motor switch protein FliM